MKKIILGFSVVLLLLVPALQWCESVFLSNHLADYRLPPGQWFYLISKLTGQYAFIFLTVQLVIGVILALWPGKFSWMSTVLHRSIGLTVLVVTLMHAGLFISAVGVRSGHFPIKLLLINLDSGFYNLFVSIGVLAAGLMLVVLLLGFIRRFLPGFLFRSAHRLAWLVWIFAFAHSYAIGTETGGWIVWSWIYLVLGYGVGFLIVFRLFSLLKKSSGKTANTKIA